MKILIDNGHGVETPGKRSPDGRLQEWSYTRLIAREIVSHLTAAGVTTQLVVPEDMDVPLPERCRRVNEVCRILGKTNVLLVSIHINAAGKGDRWMNARGWSCYTTRGDTRADALATALYEAARVHLPGMQLRTDFTDGDPDLEAGFYILRNTACAAVLSESLYMDNLDDCRFLMTEEGRRAIVRLHVEGVIKYLSTL